MTSSVPAAPVGVIDLGSNTVLVLVMDTSGSVRLDEARITRLGEGLRSGGSLRDEAKERTLRALHELSERARTAGAEHLIAVGTEALRRARDGRDFLESLKHELDLSDVQVLSGTEEARLAIEAARRSAPPGRPIGVVDVGGGSSELAWCPAGGEPEGVSVPVGSVQVTEDLLPSDPPRPREMRGAREQIRATLEGAGLSTAAADLRGGALVAVAGTATTLAALDQGMGRYDPSRVEGHRLSRSILEGWIDRLSGMSVRARRELPGMESGRADVIVAGLMILSAFVSRLAFTEFRVSGRGVRFGVALRVLDRGSGLLEGRTAVW